MDKQAKKLTPKKPTAPVDRKYVRQMMMQESYALYTALANDFGDHIVGSIKKRLDGFACDLGM